MKLHTDVAVTGNSTPGCIFQRSSVTGDTSEDVHSVLTEVDECWWPSMRGKVDGKTWWVEKVEMG